jgi:hypothetical protein
MEFIYDIKQKYNHVRSSNKVCIYDTLTYIYIYILWIFMGGYKPAYDWDGWYWLVTGIPSSWVMTIPSSLASIQ